MRARVLRQVDYWNAQLVENEEDEIASLIASFFILLDLINILLLLLFLFYRQSSASKSLCKTTAEPFLPFTTFTPSHSLLHFTYSPAALS